MLPTTPSMPVEYAVARRLARDHGWREKVLVYVTRGVEELLVLEHTDEFPEAGVQVPAGGVEPGEEPEVTAQRELFEETGLRVGGPAVHLDSHYWSTEEAPSRVRHYFWLVAPLTTPDAWSHLVSAGEDDVGISFHLSFRPLRESGLTPGYGWECALERLSAALSA